jgi:Spy/CpxP family protein refolding chaperone
VQHPLVTIVGASLLTVFAMTWTHAQQRQPASAPPQPSVEEMLKSIRGDLQNSRADIVAKNVQLTSAQAAQFWPLFENYQREQAVIMEEQLTTVQWFIDNFDKADDAAALNLINAHFERDTRMTALRQSWLGTFQNILGTKLAVRVMQIDRRLSLSHQAYVASKIPLAQ